ncbi:alpha-keto acid decarboxylase family protein [Actinomycetes bacterium NPDC127524]
MSSLQTNNLNATLGDFLFDCLKKEGITHIFGIPGDYNFTLLDTLENRNDITFINAKNELNAGYAADGYAREKGIAAMITTFGVGEMSACNAVAGAYSESVPIIHIVGSPKSGDQQSKKLMHHTLMDGDYDVFRKVYENITEYTAILTPENAAWEIPAAIKTAKKTKKPVYLSVSIDLVTKPIQKLSGQQNEPVKTNDESLKAAINHAGKLLENANNAAILTDRDTMRFGLQKQVKEFAEYAKLPVAQTMQGKGGFDETHPLYIGMYNGQFGSEAVKRIIEEADCLFIVGPVWSDVNTANFTAELNRENIIEIYPDSVKVGQAQYMNILASDMLLSLMELQYQDTEPATKPEFPYERTSFEREQLLKASTYYPLIENRLKENDIVVAETGTFSYGVSQIRLPKGASYIAQGGWQSIGYGIPAAFGACMASGNRRVLLFTGDGSLQLTVQEISSMLENDCKPIIFILNNKGYTIEKYLNVKTKNQDYNNIPEWKYKKLTEIFGEGALYKSAETNGELEDAISVAENADKLVIIEMIVKDPLDGPEYLVKMRSFLEEQEKQQA